MNAIVDACKFTASPIAFILHERKQVVIQFLNELINMNDLYFLYKIVIYYLFYQRNRKVVKLLLTTLFHITTL